MATPESSARIAKTRRRMTLERYVFVVGIALVGLYAIVRFIYEPSWPEKEAAMRATMAAKHAKVCEQLGKSAATPELSTCLDLLDGLYTRHKEAFIGENSEI